jgi:hypothetical protein
LNEAKLNSLDEIAKKAFIEVMSIELTTVTRSNSVLRTVHLEIDPGKIQSQRPGIYIIQNRITGGCIVGQTTDLRKRFNQYTNRSQPQRMSLPSGNLPKPFRFEKSIFKVQPITKSFVNFLTLKAVETFYRCLI